MYLLNSNQFDFFRSIVIVILFFQLSMLAQDCENKVTVRTSSENSAIYINSKLVKYGELDTLLEKGRYIITVSETPQMWNSALKMDTLKLTECGKYENLTYSFEDELYFDTTPQNAAVYHSDSLVGHTPLFIKSSLTNLKIDKPKYAPVNLDKIKQHRIDLSFVGEKKEFSFIESPLKEIFIGSAFVLGATSAYFKLKANDKYDRYLDTRNETYLEQTNNFDLYSGIAFGTLQVNFGILIYFFLKY